MAVGAVVQGLAPTVFTTLFEPQVRMAIWSRPSPMPPDAPPPADFRRVRRALDRPIGCGARVVSPGYREIGGDRGGDQRMRRLARAVRDRDPARLSALPPGRRAGAPDRRL